MAGAVCNSGCVLVRNTCPLVVVTWIDDSISIDPPCNRPHTLQGGLQHSEMKG